METFSNIPFISILTMAFYSLIGFHNIIRKTSYCEKYATQFLQLLLEGVYHANDFFSDDVNGRPVTCKLVMVITWLVAT